MSDKENDSAEGRAAEAKRDFRSYLVSREPSVDRLNRPRPNKQRRLFEDVNEYDEDSSSENVSETESVADSVADSVASTSTDRSSTEQGALIYLRIRPVESPSVAYALSASGDVLVVAPAEESSSSSNNKNQMEKHFSFTAIFDGSVQQRDVFNMCVGNNIQQEENFTVMTYGTSGSGKTYTLLGNLDEPGVIPRALENVFTQYANNISCRPYIKVLNSRCEILADHAVNQELQLRKKLLRDCADFQVEALHERVQSEHNFQTVDYSDTSVFIWISFVEIYNENVYDLLEPPPTGGLHSTMQPRKNLKIMSNDGKAFIKSLTSVCVKSSKEAVQLLHLGRQKASYASTNINDNSSRSHCVFIVNVLRFNGETVSEMSYKFCDLAGSERLDKTGNVGSRLKEAQRINTSLLVLGRCLDAANAKNRSTRKHPDVIPFRDSKLTMLLQSALQGREKLSMIVNITPTNTYYEENLHALNFSSIAKNIIYRQPSVKKNNTSRYSCFLQQSQLLNENQYIRQLQKESETWRQKFEQVARQNDETNRQIAELRAELAIMSQICEQEKMELENTLRNQLVDDFEKELLQRKTVYEENLNQLKRSHEEEIAFLKSQHVKELENLRDNGSEDESIDAIVVDDD